MSKTMLVLVVAWLAFAALSNAAVAQFGYFGLWRLIGQDLGTVQLFADLTVAMVLVTSWMVRDSRTSGVAAWPYIALTVAGGSVGPLSYLIHRAWRRQRALAPH